MKPVDQDVFTVPGGNCFSACVASLLELPLADVPYFMGQTDDHDWLGELNTWLAPRVLYALCLTFGGDYELPGLFILGGQSPRGDWCHAVVARGRGEVVHDPHPSRAGVLSLEDATLLVPLDPANVRGAA